MYQTLQQRLTKFQSFVEKWPNLSVSPLTTEVTTEQALLSFGADASKNESALSSLTLMEQFKVLKDLWLDTQQSLENLALPQYGQALHTEMHKQFRLMEVDITFLKTARQARTIAQRKQQLSNRLRQLIEYCETGIKLSQQMGEEA